MESESDLAARYAPVLYLEAHDPPGDPAAYLAHCQLVWWSDEGGSKPAASGPIPLTRARWHPDGLMAEFDGGELTRPFESSPARRAPLDQGFCLEPSPPPPKYLAGAGHAGAIRDEFGRSKERTPRKSPPPSHPVKEADRPGGLFLLRLDDAAPDAQDASAQRAPVSVEAPCFFDIEHRRGGRYRITYWFFYPTSTLPLGEWEAVITALAASGAALPIARDSRAFESVRPGPPPDDSPTRTELLSQARSLDDFFEAQLQPGEKIAWSSPWSILLGESGHAAGKNKNVLGQTLEAVLTGLAYYYEVQARLLRDVVDRYVKAPGVAAAELLSISVRQIATKYYVHQGDWEAVSIELDAARELQRVAFWGHGIPILRRPQEVTFCADEHGRHLEAVVGTGSHASYPDHVSASLRKDSVAHPSRRAIWRTQTNLHDARKQLWYGFGGAWGRARLPPIGRLRRRQFRELDLWKESTGPLGPGPLKLAVQDAAIARAERDAPPES